MKNRTTPHYESHMRKLAIHSLPIINFITCFFAVFPLLSFKITNLSPTAVFIIALLLSLFCSYSITLLERIAIASSTNELWDTLILASTICMIPAMHICKEIAFFDGETFRYSCSFALISLILQITSLTAYKRQMKFDRDIHKENNDETV